MGGTYESAQPWVVYHFGATQDKWWPFWNSTRVLGYAVIGVECAVCGVEKSLRIKVPRFGAVEDKGHHPERIAFLTQHEHADRGNPMSWAKPLLNPFANGGINLDLFAMRLESDLNEGET